MSKTAAPARSVPNKRGQGRPLFGGNDVGRERLLIATEKLLRTMPPARVTISCMAREANADSAPIRNYFGNCAPLLHRLINDELEQDGTEESRARVRSMQPDLVDFYRRLLEADGGRERPGGFRSSSPAWCWMDCATRLRPNPPSTGRDTPVKE